MKTASLEWAQSWLQKDKKHYIKGQWGSTASDQTFTSINPANGESLTSFQEGSQEDVHAAVLAARVAFDQGPWKTLPKRERSKLLHQIGDLVNKHACELATLESLDNGKLYRESLNDDLPDSGDVFHYYAGWTDKHYGETCPVSSEQLNYTTKEPLGVCALIVPWNFPLLMAAWKLAPALATGNTLVIKPSPFTSLSLIRMFELIHEHVDLPPGVINLLLGGAETGDMLTKHMDVDKVSFTGSTAVGKRIVQNSGASNLKKVSLELGGKSPNIVFDDVSDLDFAIQQSFTALFSHKGEKCSEPTRFFIHKNKVNQFLETMSGLADKMICGDPFHPKSDQGAQCHQEHLNKVLHYIQLGIDEGATLVAGGERDTRGACAKGYFVRPTIFSDVKPHMKIAQDEIFGPVLCVSSFETEDEVIKLANETTYGLAAGFWTRNVSRAHKVAAKLDAGMIFINKYGMYDFSSPFGGFKQSGWGKDMGRHSLDEYTKTKSIWIHLEH